MTSELANQGASTPGKSGARQRRGARAYLGASTIAQGCALIRYTVLARLLGPEQLGLAATLVLTSQFFESITDSGSDRFLIQDQDGDAPQAQDFVQMVFVVRGLFLAAALVAFSGPIAAFYHTPSLAFGLAALALSPLINGFLHLDMRRLQRHDDFRSEGAALLFGECSGLCATLVAALLTRSYVSILYGLTVRAAVTVLVSHLRAERRYRIGFSAALAPRLARYAVPLMFNGLLLFLGSQGDRVLIGNQLGLAALGRYSALLLLIFYPSAVITRYMATLHLPGIAASRDDRSVQAEAIDRLAGRTVLIGAFMCFAFVLVSPIAVVALYGKEFRQSLTTIGLVGILQTIRFIRLWPNTVALATGRTGIVLVNNIARLVGLPIGLFAAAAGWSLNGIVVGLTVGEFIALATAIAMLNWNLRNKPLHDFDRFSIFILVGAAVLSATALAQHANVVSLLISVAALVGVIAWTGVRERRTIAELVNLAHRLRDRWGAAA